MAKKHQKAAAAHARARRQAQAANPSLDEVLDSETNAGELWNQYYQSDSDLDREYTGGINCEWSDSDYETSLSELWSDSDVESLEELEGDELEVNLQELREEVEMLAVPTGYEEISKPKLAKTWKKAEKNRTLGYNGNSQRTAQRKAKEARDRGAAREQARNLYVALFCWYSLTKNVSGLIHKYR